MNSSVIDVKGKDPVAETETKTDTVEVIEADPVAKTDTDTVKVTNADTTVKVTETAVKVTEADKSEVNETDAADDKKEAESILQQLPVCLLYTSPSPRDS